MAALLAVALLVTGAGARASAQTLVVSGNPGHMQINSAVPGSDLDPAVNVSTTYSLVAGTYASKIMARLTSDLPPGVALTIALAAPPEATSTGPVALSTSWQDVVLDIPAEADASGLNITFQLTALLTAGTTSELARTVTLSLVEM